MSTSVQLSQSSEIKMTLALDLIGERTTDVYARIIRSEQVDGHFRSSMEFTTNGDEGLRTIKQYVGQLVASH